MSIRKAPSKGDRHGNGKGAVVVHQGTPSIVPPKLRHGQVRYPACRKGVALTSAGRLRSHVDLFDAPCPNRLPDLGRRVALAEVPEVDVPRESTLCTPLDGHCMDCGKFIGPDRRLCGRCFALGGRP